jgi:peptidoglycan L-alanyl-D-glutamate endopeptidase CwlK
MPQFSKSSKSKLETCHPDLQKLFNEVIKEKDCVIICGARTLEEQQKAFKGGFSKLDGIVKKSKHQIDRYQPLSLAVDVLPFPLKWDDKLGHIVFSDYVKFVAKKLGIKITWGGDWKFVDRPHYQL